MYCCSSGWNKRFRYFLKNGALQQYKITKGVRVPDLGDGDGWPLFAALIERFNESVEHDGSQFAVFDEGIGNPYRLQYDSHAKLKAIYDEGGIQLIPARHSFYERYEENIHTNVVGNAQMLRIFRSL